MATDMTWAIEECAAHAVQYYVDELRCLGLDDAEIAASLRDSADDPDDHRDPYRGAIHELRDALPFAVMGEGADTVAGDYGITVTEIAETARTNPDDDEDAIIARILVDDRGEVLDDLADAVAAACREMADELAAEDAA